MMQMFFYFLFYPVTEVLKQRGVNKTTSGARCIKDAYAQKPCIRHFPTH